MLILFRVLLFFSCCYFAHAAQPYFPPQIVFSILGGELLYAIDETNQRAVLIDSAETAFVFKHIPYAIPNSPEDKYYVQLINDHDDFACAYETYWAHGINLANFFPPHWTNGTSFEIKNYLEFNNEMIHSTNSSDTEDYWYANKTCQVDSGATYPCDEIYFKKNTNIPLRSTQVRRFGRQIVQMEIEYNVISVGEIDEKYFDALPKNWSIACLDLALRIFIDPKTSKIPVEQSVIVQVWLQAPPHRVNGTDTVTIQWNVTNGCTDCLTWKPTQLTFNTENFQERQNITFTRTKAGLNSTLYPIFYGGGFDLVPTDFYRILIE